MGNRKPQFRASVLACSLIVAAVVGCRPPTPDAAIDDKSLSITAGVGGLVKPDRWCRLIVTARTKEGVFDGELVVSGLAPPATRGPERHRRRVGLSTAAQTFETLWLPRTNDIRVEVAFRGRSSLRRVEVELVPGRLGAFNVLGIGDRPSASVQLAIRDVLGERQDIQIGSIGAAGMPRHALGYDCVDLVIAFEDELTTADPDQLRALGEWIDRGGTVAGVPGPAWETRAIESFGEIFGLTEPHRRGDEFLENERGAGRALILPKASPDDAWRYVVGCAHPEKNPVSIIRGAEIDTEASRYFATTTGARFPPRSNVVAFVLAYMGIGLVLSRVVFRRRKEFSFLVAILLAAVSCVGILYLGLLSGIKETSIEAVTYGVLGADGKRVETVSWFGVSSPTRALLDLDGLPTDPEGIVVLEQPAPVDPGDEPAPLDYESSARSVTSRNAVIYPNSTRVFRLERTIALDGEVSARWLDEGASRRIEIHNGTSTALALELLSNNRIADLRTARAGGSITRTERSLSLREVWGQHRERGSRPYMRRTEPPDIIGRLLSARTDFIVARPEASYSGLDALGPLGNETRILVIPVR